MGQAIGTGAAVGGGGTASDPVPAAVDDAAEAPVGRRSVRARRTVAPPSPAARIATADPLFGPGTGYWVNRPLQHPCTNDRARIGLPKGVTIFRRLDESERIEDTKELLIRRPVDGLILTGTQAKTAVGLEGGATGDVDIDEVPSHWEVFATAKSNSRTHPVGTVLLVRMPMPKPLRGPGGPAAKRARTPKVVPSETGAGSPEIFGGCPSNARAMVTWTDRFLFATCGTNSVCVFNLETGELIRVLQSSLYQHSESYGLAVEGDRLLIPVRQFLGDSGEVLPVSTDEFTTERTGVLALSLPELDILSHYWSLPTDLVSPRNIRVHGNELVGVAANGQWCVWNVDSSALVRHSPPLSRERPERGIFNSVGGAGRWQFYASSSAFDVTTGEEYIYEIEGDAFTEVLSHVSSHCEIRVADGVNDMQCRLFVGCEGKFTGVAEVLVDFTLAHKRRVEARAAHPAPGQTYFDSEDDKDQPVYTVIRKIAMPDDGPHGYRGPCGLMLRGNLLYVNCSLYAFVTRLAADGASVPIWSVNHAEGDTNEMWDGTPVAADAAGACYVSTATEDPRYTSSSGHAIVCIKRFRLPPAAFLPSTDNVQ